MILTRTTPTTFEIGEKRRLNFYAAVFGQPTTITEKDRAGSMVTYREQIRSGAFTQTLAGGHEVIANINHDPKRTFAKRSTSDLLLQQDGHGLFCSCWLPETPIGDEVLKGVKDGTITGCSFRFTPVEDELADDILERVAVHLEDVCVALGERPAYDGTEVYLRTQSKVPQLLAQLGLLKFKVGKLLK